MKFLVYILESRETGKYYIGQTQDLESRLRRHNSGRNKSTKSGRPWTIKFFKEFNTRKEATSEERKLKSLKKRVSLEKHIKDNKYRGIAQSG